MTNIPEFTVSQISNAIKMVVEDSFGYVKIKGEISGFKKAASGHLYFNLKDEDALINAVLFRGMASKVDFDLEDGLMVDAYGRVTTYGGRSCYQIIVEKIEIGGAGAIMQMLEKRKEKLAKEGLFDEKHKKDLPFFPSRIGVISSKTGAVIQDIVNRVEARCKTHIMLYSVAVQGKNASKEVIEGLNYFAGLSKKERPEVLIIARGGGSVEDLLPFSDEELVRKVFEYDLPIISAIGHETDFCLLDFVADLRAATPTAAAEMATIVFDEIKMDVDMLYKNLLSAKERFLKQKNDEFKSLSRLIKSPRELIDNMEERFKIFAKNISISLKNILSLKTTKFNGIDLRKEDVVQKILIRQQRLDSLGEILKSRSHNDILRRGFCMINDENGNLIANINQLKIAQNVDVKGLGGSAKLEVKKINLEK